MNMADEANTDIEGGQLIPDEGEAEHPGIQGEEIREQAIEIEAVLEARPPIDVMICEVEGEGQDHTVHLTVDETGCLPRHHIFRHLHHHRTHLKVDQGPEL